MENFWNICWRNSWTIPKDTRQTKTAGYHLICWILFFFASFTVRDPARPILSVCWRPFLFNECYESEWWGHYLHILSDTSLANDGQNIFIMGQHWYDNMDHCRALRYRYYQKFQKSPTNRKPEIFWFPWKSISPKNHYIHCQTPAKLKPNLG